MSSRFQVARVLRLGVSQYVNTNYIQIRQMARRGSPLIPKAIYNSEGNYVDTSRLGQLNKNIEETNAQREIPIKPIPISNERKKKEEYSPTFKQNQKHSGKKENNKEVKSIKTQEDIDQEEEELTNQSYEKRGFHIPHYSKIYGWEKKNNHLKELGKSLSHNNAKSDSVVLEGTRLINDALNSGLQPNIFIFSQVKLLKEIDTKNIDSACEFYLVPYSNIKMWSDLTTPTGVMAAFDKTQIRESVKPTDALPITLICDNVRTPDNLGSILRVAGAAGVNKILLTPGCVCPWNRKVLRSGAGIHFKVPIVEKVSWEEIKTHIDAYPQVVICDICSEKEGTLSDAERLEKLNELQQPDTPDDDDDEDEYEEKDVVNANILSKYRQIPIATVPFNKFKLNPGVKDVVMVVGGETEGVSDASYKFCHDLNGSRLHIPLRNEVNSLNVISATSVALFTIQQQFHK